MTKSESFSEETAQILVVDDTPANLKLLNEMLSNRGYRVRPASNGRLALRSLAAAPPDLILLDVMMPEMDGYEVCQRLKSDETSRGIPVIFISALDSVDDKIRGFEAGGVDYITKPFQEAEVLARVETHLLLRRLQKRLEKQNALLQREIVERERFESELKRHQERLEEIIAERTQALRDSEIQNARIKRDLELAQEIQQSFLPQYLPRQEGLLMACHCEPAANVGGDYYDFFYPGENILDVVIADVAGHSIGSALLMIETRSVLHARAGLENPPGKLLAVVNDLLYEDLSRAELLNSMFYTRLDLNNHTLTYANAGHTRSQLFRSEDTSFEELDADGMLMGIKREVFFEEKQTGISAGDILLLYTDGITEAENQEGALFGTERLHEVIIRNRDCRPEKIMSAVFQKLLDFTGDKPHADDMTIVILKIV